MVGKLPPSQLVEVLRADRRQRWAKGERVLAEVYLHRHPELAADPERALELVYHEVLLREELGEAPRLEEYLRRFPQLVGRLKPLFEVHQALESGGVLETAGPEGGRRIRAVENSAVPPPAVPGYEVLGRLGRGGMGVVYRARDLRLNRLVALKMVLGGLNAGASYVARFRAEAEAQARLQHPNIVQIYEVGDAGGCPYFALEHVPGGRLDDRIRGRPQAPRPAAELVESLARAVHYAHQRGLVHRDLKPSNILLTSGGVPKITDFGLAKRVASTEGGGPEAGGRSGASGSGPATPTPTQSGEVLGTPSYMAPEQAKGHADDVGPAADVYGLGVILYELLTGRPPFLAETSLATLIQVQTLDPVPPRRLGPAVPRDLETICLKCLQKDPRRRYDSALALADDLRRFLAGEPIRARPVSWAGRGWRWARRNRALAAVSTVAVVGLVAATAVSILFALYQAGTAQGLRQEQHQARRRAALQALDQGLLLCEQGSSRGLLFLARGLREAPEDATDIQRAARINLAGWANDFHLLQRCLGHGGGVYAVAFSPDGKTALTAGGDQAAHLWDAATGRPLGLPPLRHGSLIEAAAFSPDGQTIVTGGRDKVARLWNAGDGKKLGDPMHHGGAVTAAAFSPDGRRVVTGSVDGKARFWDAATGAPLDPVISHGRYITALAFDTDGTVLLTGARDTMARRWDAATGKPLGEPLPHDHAVLAVAFHPDGRLVLTGCFDGTARLWDTATEKEVCRLRHQAAVQGVAFHADGRCFLTASADRSARLWDLTGRPLGNPLVHGGWVMAGAFHPDGNQVLTGSLDRTARLWQLAAPPDDPRRTLTHRSWVQAVAWRPDGGAVATGGRSNRVRIWYWDADNGKFVRRPLRAGNLEFLHGNSVRAVAYSPDGQSIMTGSEDRTAQLWDAATGEARFPQPLPHDNGVEAVAFSPDGRLLLTGGRDKTARLWDAATGRPHGAPLLLKDHVHAVAFSPDGQTILTGGGFADRGEARIWGVATGKPLRDPIVHQAAVVSVAFARDGQTFLTGTEDGQARLWETATGRPRGNPLPHDGWVRSVAISPDGQLLLTGSTDGRAWLWDVVTGKRLGPPLRHDASVWTVAFRPDGKAVLTGGQDRKARLWTVPAAVPGDSERLAVWVQVLTGMELDEELGYRVLDPATWQQRRERLQELGGPPPL